MIIRVLAFFLVGIICGSFIGCLNYRLYHKLSLWSRSFCLNCRQKILFRDLVPLASFLRLRGKCRSCGQNIKVSHFFIELFAGLLLAFLVLKYHLLSGYLIRDAVFILVLYFILIFDWQHYQILDVVIWPALIFSFLFNIFLGQGTIDLIAGMAIGCVFFLTQYLFSRGNWLGLGDVKLGVLIGAMFGWQITLLIIVMAYIIGGIVAIILLIFKIKRFGDILPMGSFLAGSGIIVIFAGELILNFVYG